MAKSPVVGLVTLIVANLLLQFHQASSSRILLYPYGHCLNSHLLSAERMAEILTNGGHEVDMLVSTAYNSYLHRNKRSSHGRQDSNSTGLMVEQSSDKFSDKVKMETEKESSCEQSPTPDGQVNCNSEFRHNSYGAQYNDKNEDSKHPKGGKLNLIQFQSPEDYYPVCEFDTLDFMLNAPLNDRFNALIDTSVKYCDAILSDVALLKRLKSNSYSVLVLESVDPCSRVLADYLDQPFILLVTTGLGHWDSNPRPPSYLPAAIAPFTSTMSFPQRVVNLVLKLLYDTAIPAYLGFMDHFEALKERHGINVTISVEDTFKRAALKFVNSDFSVEYPAPIEPDTVLVGGFGVGKPSKLPQDLQDFADGASEHGLIVFSFGTLVRRYGKEWTELFLQALGRLPQRVIWRYNEEELTNRSAVPANIKLIKWLPQVSLLAHPNTRLFISHCGLNALYEAAHFGVPVLALPLSGDQFNNAAKIAHHLNMGIYVDINSMTADSLHEDLLRVLSDQIFLTNAKRVASHLRDQPMTVAEKILFWVNYVIRHNGAEHLRSAAGSIPLYQYFSLDVIAVLLIGLLTALTILILCCYKLILLTIRLSIFCSVKFFRKVVEYDGNVSG